MQAVPLDDKKVEMIAKKFEKLVKGSSCKLNKIQVDKISELYDRSIKS